MKRSRTAAMLALGVLSLSARRAAAQATIEPASPRWGESITITVEPNRGAKEGERADPSEQLYVVLSPVRQGSHLSRFERPWTPMTWDGRRFVARMTVPYGCETGSVSAATAERMIDGTTAFFICRATDGRLPPGALISALMGPGRDKPNWKAEVEEDVARGRARGPRGNPTHARTVVLAVQGLRRRRRRGEGVRTAEGALRSIPRVGAHPPRCASLGRSHRPQAS
jgi:hypothetical protein